MTNRYFNVKKVLFFCFLAGLLSACQSIKKIGLNKVAIDLTPKTQMEKDQAKIQQYIKTKGLTTSVTPSGIHYVIEKEGDGEHPSSYAVATVHYRGTFLDGTQFWSSYDSGEVEKFQLHQVVEGWMQGVPLLKKGGKGLFIIPSDLAYGAGGRGDQIQPHKILVFEIELVDFYEVQLSKEVQLIEDYVIQNNLNMKKTKSGIFYNIESVGNGWGPVLDSEITINYTGKILDGEAFWSTYDNGKPIKTKLRESIRAFGEILPMLREGGKVKMIVPSILAYGRDGWQSKIPPNSTLIYDLELVDVE